MPAGSISCQPKVTFKNRMLKTPILVTESQHHRANMHLGLEERQVAIMLLLRNPPPQ